MSGSSIKLDLKDVFELSKRLEGLEKPLRPLMVQIANSLKNSTKERFETTKAPEGKTWVKGKKATGKTLTLSGLLNQSITSFADGEKAIVGTNKIYAGIHQFGGVIKQKKRSITMPARPFLGLSEDDKDTISYLINEHLNKGLSV